MNLNIKLKYFFLSIEHKVWIHTSHGIFRLFQMYTQFESAWKEKPEKRIKRKSLNFHVLHSRNKRFWHNRQFKCEMNLLFTVRFGFMTQAYNSSIWRIWVQYSSENLENKCFECTAGFWLYNSTLGEFWKLWQLDLVPPQSYLKTKSFFKKSGRQKPHITDKLSCRERTTLCLGI